MVKDWKTISWKEQTHKEFFRLKPEKLTADEFARKLLALWKSWKSKEEGSGVDAESFTPAVVKPSPQSGFSAQSPASNSTASLPSEPSPTNSKPSDIDIALGLQTPDARSMEIPEKTENDGDAREYGNTESPLEFAHQHPCPYRTLFLDKTVLCMENKKVPLEACVNRQKRYVHFQLKCVPIGYKPKPKHRQDASQSNRPYSGDTDRYVGDHMNPNWRPPNR